MATPATPSRHPTTQAPSPLRSHTGADGARSFCDNGACFRMLALGCLGLAALGLAACERELESKPRPLRPLAYTESPPEADVVVEPTRYSPMYVSPEDLGLAVYQALVEHRREVWEGAFVNTEELVDLVRMEEDKAAASVAELLRKSEQTWQLFAPANPSEESVGGLGSLFRMVEFKVGKGRDLAGKIVRPGVDEIAQHWGNELRIELIDSDKSFFVRLPKIVLTKDGWKLAQALEVDASLRMFLDAGMQLKPELLSSDHTPYPLEVGNYWKYQLRQIGTSAQEALEAETAERPPTDAAPQAAALPPATPLNVTVTVTVTELIRRRGYLLASLERLTQSGEITRQAFHYLVTPRHIYLCTRDCFNAMDDIAYLLGYMSQQVPIMVFPLARGAAWDKAGATGVRNRYEIKPDTGVRTVVPAGDFADPFVIVGSIEEGREERFFVPGTGVVRRWLRSGTGPRVEELVEFRLLL